MPKISNAGGATYNQPRPGGELGELQAASPELAGSEPDTLDNRSFAPIEPLDPPEQDQAQREAEWARGEEERPWDGDSSSRTPSRTEPSEKRGAHESSSAARTTESPTASGRTGSDSASSMATAHQGKADGKRQGR